MKCLLGMAVLCMLQVRNMQHKMGTVKEGEGWLGIINQ